LRIPVKRKELQNGSIGHRSGEKWNEGANRGGILDPSIVWLREETWEKEISPIPSRGHPNRLQGWGFVEGGESSPCKKNEYLRKHSFQEIEARRASGVYRWIKGFPERKKRISSDQPHKNHKCIIEGGALCRKVHGKCTFATSGGKRGDHRVVENRSLGIQKWR